MTRRYRRVFTCPRCSRGAETISYVSVVCGSLKGLRLSRNNTICNLVEKKVVKHNKNVSVEFPYPVRSDILIPDF